MLAASQRDAAAAKEREQLLATAHERVKELEACLAARGAAGDTRALLASEMEFLRKERRAEVEQVDAEWRRRWEELQAEDAQLRAAVDAAAAAAARAAELHAHEVEAVR